MANVMSFKNVKNRPHRSAFDLSYKNALTAKVGELLPCFVKEVLPGDEFHISPSNFTRTSPVNTAAFTRIRENVDFFFVPYRLLWDKWTQFIAQTNDPHFAAGVSSSPSNFNSTPFTTITDLYAFLNQLKEHDGTGSSSAYLDACGFPAYGGAIKLLQYLGYGAITYPRSVGSGGTTILQDDTALSMFRLCAYQKIYYDFYRNSQWEFSKPYCYNFDYMFTNSSLKYDMNSLRGSISSSLPFDTPFTLRYANYAKDLTMGLNPSPQFGDTAIAGPIIGNGAISSNFAFNDTAVNLRVSPYDSSLGHSHFYLAYQTGSSSPTKSLTGFSGFSDPSGVSDPTDVSTSLNSSLIPLSIPASAQSGISVLALRLAESLQKYREITLTGSKDYKDQIEKHWGVRVPDYASDLCQRVYSYDSMIEISEVINQSLNSGENADIKGRGVSAGSGSFTWKNTSNDYGVLMGIYHAEPLIDYQSDLFLERTLVNCLPSSFPVPELDSIGMEAVPRFCVSVPSRSSQGNPFIDTDVQGYAPRYFEYKTSRDIVNGGFGSYGGLLRGTDSGALEFNGGYASWVSKFGKEFYTRLNSSTLDYQTFKIDPRLLNSIFVAQVSSTPKYLGTTTYPSYEDEQLLCKFFFDCKVNRNLSYDGLPY